MGSFREEWAAMQAAAREDVARTRLNANEGGGAGPNGTLVADWQAKRAAAGYLTEEVRPRALRAGLGPKDEVSRVATRLSGFETAEGARTVLERWVDKVRALDVQLEAEAGLLRGVASGFQGVEAEAGYRMRQATEGIAPTPLIGFE
ncbi:hypothetical protein [Streptomyces sp. NPDC127098]|uniref:hypothetical protein n=1 Tax=Streptomyces sp. NPDC127098 TaxID=3347137 RepID=UPI003658DBD1